MDIKLTKHDKGVSIQDIAKIIDITVRKINKILGKVE